MFAGVCDAGAVMPMMVWLQVSVLDKSKMDWQDFKKTDKEIQEELEAHARSDKQYLDKKVGGLGSVMPP